MIKKISNLIILLVFTFTSLTAPFWQAKQVEAQFITIDFGQIWDNVKEQVLVPMAAAVADRLIDKLVNDTINWANGGFEGEPGFVNNWDDFLRDTQYEIISGAFQAAVVAAGTNAYQTEFDNITSYTNCKNRAIADYKLRGLTSDQNEHIKKTCGDEQKIDTTISAKINSCQNNPETLRSYITTIGQRDKYQEHLNEYCEPIRETRDTTAQERNRKYQTCLAEAPEKFLRKISRYNTTEYKAYIKQKCNIIAEAANTTFVGNIAQTNYQSYQNGEIKSTRDIARNIANYGVQELTQNNLTNLFKGKGETLSKILERFGSNKDEFNQNISAAGWQGYIALSDPHNYNAGLQALVTEEISKQAANAVKNQINDIQTENKFLDKIECIGIRSPDGTCKGKEVTNTPGSVVENAIKKGFENELDQAGDLNGILANSLIKGIGKLTDGLLEVGVSKSSKKANETFFKKKDVQNLINESGISLDYQSEYDVLGISSSGFSESYSETVNSLDEESRIKSMIGGPEDRTGNPQADPQIIIDLKNNLEDAIEYGKKEQVYYDKIESRINQVKDAAAKLDQCIPGPDYGWQDRYDDRLKSHKETEKQTNNLLGLADTEDMTSDPLVNIPGAAQMKEIFRQVAEGDIINNPEIKQRISDLRDVRNTLNKMTFDLEAQLSKIKREENLPNLILFRTQWDKDSETDRIFFSQERKIQAYQSALDLGYAVIPEELGITTTEYVANFDEKARDAVISMTWELWRKKTPRFGETIDDEYISGKTDVRYLFHVINSEISNETFAETARTKEQQFSQYASDVPKLLNDCLVLKLFATGYGSNLPNPKKITEINSNKAFDSFIGINKTLGDVGTAGGILFGPIGMGTSIIGFINRNDINFIRDRGITDTMIKDFLNKERAKQESGQASYFLTNYVTSQSSINNSILGFEENKKVTVKTPRICEYPNIYRISFDSLDSNTVTQDYDRDELNIQFNGGSTGGGSTTVYTYTGEPTGNACTDPDETYQSCEFDGDLFCNGGVEYDCVGDPTTIVTPATNGGSASGDYDPTESGTRLEIDGAYIYIDEEGNGYDVSAKYISADGKSASYFLIGENDKKYNYLNPKVFDNNKPVINEKCTGGDIQSFTEKDDYFNQKYPYDDEFYKDMKGNKIFGRDDRDVIKPAKTVFEIFKQDRAALGSGISARISGVLYCRNRNGAAQCTKNWYTASELNYRILFSGINSRY